MPDLTTEYATACETQRAWSREILSSSDPSKTYTLSWGPLYGLQAEAEGAQYGYTCTCWPFRKDGICTHTRAGNVADLSEVQGPTDRCGWDNRFMVPTETTDEGKCPMCDADTFTYSYGA